MKSMVRRNLYAVLGMAAWKYAMPYARKRLKNRKDERRQTAAIS